jgi:hypothetical protein
MQPEKRTQSRSRGPRKETLPWEPVKLVIHKETKIAARVFRLNLQPRPKYSYEIGCVDEEETFLRFLIPVVTSKGGVVDLEPITQDGVSWVMMEAEAFMAEELQKREHELVLQAKSRSKR